MILKNLSFLSSVIALAGLVLPLRVSAEALLSTVPGARAQGMGAAFSSLADDPSAMFHNPAGLGLLEYTEVTGEYRFLSRKAKGLLMYGLLPQRIRDGSVGVAIQSYEARSGFSRRGSSWGISNRAEQQYLLSYGRLFDNYALGASLKFTHWSHYQESATTVGLDLGFIYQITPRWSVGAVARDLIHTEPNFEDSDETTTDRTFTGGVALTPLWSARNWELTGAADLVWNTEEGSGKLRVGGELRHNLPNGMTLSGRLGADGSRPAVGAGMIWDWCRIDCALAKLPDQDFYEKVGVTFSVSVIPVPFWSWLTEKRDLIPRFARPLAKAQAGSPVDDTEGLQAAEDLERVPASPSAIEAVDGPTGIPLGRQGRLLGRVEIYHQQRNYQMALDLLNLILADDPHHEKALASVREVKESRELEKVFELALADKAEREGSLLKALASYSRVCRLDSTGRQAQTGRTRVENMIGATRMSTRGVLTFNSGHYDSARTGFSRALKSDPDDAVSLEYIRKLDSTLSRVVSLDDIEGDSVLWPAYLEGLEASRNEEYQKAVDAWLKVLRAYPNCPEIREAVRDARSRLELSP